MIEENQAMSEAVLDLDRQEEAREYARIRRRLMVLDLALGGLYALAWLVLGWSKALEGMLLELTTNVWLLVAAFGAIFGGIYFLLGLPLSYFSGYTLPHRYGLSTQTFKGWVIDQVKSVMVGGALALFVLEVIYAVLRSAPDTWWLWAGVILLFFNVILANLAPVLLFPIFYKFTPLGDEHAELVERLVRLAERAKTHVRGVYQFDMSRRTKAANAALTGLGNTRRIILGDTLIKEFTEDEIETVMAHELGHHVHRDLPIGLLVESVITLGGLYLASVGLDWGVTAFGFESPADIAALPLFALVIGAYGLLTMPLVNAYSRWRERRADEYALQATGNGKAYASALARLANQNLAEADPEPWVEFLLYSHPALGKRIAMALEINFRNP
jgi:STE24 endopeptidase